MFAVVHIWQVRDHRDAVTGLARKVVTTYKYPVSARVEAQRLNFLNGDDEAHYIDCPLELWRTHNGLYPETNLAP